MKYVNSISDNPCNRDYFWEATKTTNYHFPRIAGHSHDYYEIFILLVGDACLKIENEVYPIIQGDIIVFPPHMHHQVLLANEDNKDSLYERIYMYVTEPCLNSFDFRDESIRDVFELAAQRHKYLFHIQNHEDYADILDCMLYLYRSKKNQEESELVKRASLLKLLAVLAKDIKEELEKDDSNPLARQIAQYVKEHCRERVTMKSLSDYFYVNEQSLSKTFRKQHQMSIHDYCNQCRIEIAKEKMQEGFTLSEASDFVGFTDYSTFYRTFKKVVGKTPKEYAREIEH